MATPFLAARLLGRDQSIVVVTEGKGPQKFHDRIVLLVNEHTAGLPKWLQALHARTAWQESSAQRPPDAYLAEKVSG